MHVLGQVPLQHQANDQRTDLTSMERGRALKGMLKDGEDLYRDAQGRKGSPKALADSLHRSVDVIQNLIRSATVEDELYKSDQDRPAGRRGPSENEQVYRYTAALKKILELRKELIAFISSNQTGLSGDGKSLRQVAQALSYAPDSKDQIFAMIEKKISPEVMFMGMFLDKFLFNGFEREQR